MSKPARKKPSGKSSARSKASSRGKGLAGKADRHALYEASVQAPETDAESLAALFGFYRDREPMSLREDFCGTAVLSLAWVKSKAGRTAVGVDLDEPTMEWGREHRIGPAGEDVARRIKLHQANVLDGVGPKVDIAAALNFSYFVFHQRKDLVAYFKAARRKLVDDGVFILDLVGGWESMSEEINRRDVDGVRYVWEQKSFEPRTHHFVCSISFEFPDGSRMDDAFVYDWRLWTAPELCDALYEAGFSNVHVMWELEDEDGDPTGEFYEPDGEVTNDASWWTFIVAER